MFVVRGKWTGNVNCYVGNGWPKHFGRDCRSAERDSLTTSLHKEKLSLINNFLGPHPGRGFTLVCLKGLLEGVGLTLCLDGPRWTLISGA